MFGMANHLGVMKPQGPRQLEAERESNHTNTTPWPANNHTMSRQRKSNKMIKQPIQIIFGNLQSKKRVSVALYESDNTIEGIIIGFDEYMNLVLDEVTTHESSGSVTSLGRILLKGENITWIADAA